MKTSDYWEEYMKAAEAGESRKSFSERVGVSTRECWRRTYEKRQQGYDIPQLPTKRGDLPDSEFAEIMAKHGIKKTEVSKPAAKKATPKKATPKPEPAKPEPQEEISSEDSLPEEIAELLRGVN